MTNTGRSASRLPGSQLELCPTQHGQGSTPRALLPAEGTPGAPGHRPLQRGCPRSEKLRLQIVVPVPNLNNQAP